MSKTKKSGYRAIPDMPTFDENSVPNRRSNASWKNVMCCSCFQCGTVVVKGRLYCDDCDPRKDKKDENRKS